MIYLRSEIPSINHAMDLVRFSVLLWASQVVLVVKSLPTSTEDPGSIPGSGRYPGGELGNPLQYSCPENLQGERSVMGYRPWGHKESDMTEVT